MRLVLGPGRKVHPGYLRIDFDPSASPDLLLDLEQAKLPLPSNSVEEILAEHVLEHVRNLLPLLQECWRVLKKPGGKMVVEVPAWPNSERALSDPGHVRFFTEETFQYLAGRRRHFLPSKFTFQCGLLRLSRTQLGDRRVELEAKPPQSAAEALEPVEMRILLGSLVHVEKDYCAQEFVECACALLNEVEEIFHLAFIDTSPSDNAYPIQGLGAMASKPATRRRVISPEGTSRLNLAFGYLCLFFEALMRRASHLLILEADVLPTLHECRLLIEAGKAVGNAIVTAAVWKPGENHYQVYSEQRRTGNKFLRKPLSPAEIEGASSLLPCRAASFSFILIPEEWLKARLPYLYREGAFNHPDCLFFEVEMPLCVEPRVRPRHERRPWKKVRW